MADTVLWVGAAAFVLLTLGFLGEMMRSPIAGDSPHAVHSSDSGGSPRDLSPGQVRV